MQKRFRVTLIFELTGDDEIYPDNQFFQEQWEQTASGAEGDLILVEKVEEIPDVENKKL
jgi:hypothetical protein